MVADAGDIIGVSQWIRPARPDEPPEEKKIFVVHFRVDAPLDFEPDLSEEHTEKVWVDDPTPLLPKGLNLEPFRSKKDTAEADRHILLDIPGFGRLEIRYVFTDYTGTHAFSGRLRPGVRRRLERLAGLIEVHVVTSDTFGTAKRELAGLPVHICSLKSERHDEEKVAYLGARDLRQVAVFGNGRNDRLMLQAVKDAGGLAVAVDNGEGCAVETMQAANLLIHGSENALDLLLEPARCVATLRTKGAT